MSAEPEEGVPEGATETVVDIRSVEFTEDEQFFLNPDEERSGIQVPGPGVIDTVYIKADSNQFNTKVETDRATFVEDDWSALDNISANAPHITTATVSGDNVLVIEDVPYQEYSVVTIEPLAEVTFRDIRGVWFLGAQTLD